MRIQHNIIPPAPGRGGNRKRKREEPEPVPVSTGDGYGSFKVDTPDMEDELFPMLEHANGEHTNGAPEKRSATPDGDEEDDEEEIPPYLMEKMDKNTGLILGKTPAMVRYIIMKAKHKHVLDEHANLIEELRMVRYEERRWRERKDALLDDVLRATFG